MSENTSPIEEPNIPSQKRDGALIYEIESALNSGVVSKETVQKIIDYIEGRGISRDMGEQAKSILLKSLGHAGYIKEGDGKIILNLVKEAENRQL